MRVLWVTQNGGNYKNPTLTGTGGWIGAMQEEFCKRNPSIELGITFFHSTDSEDCTLGKVSYLPVEYDYGNTLLSRWYYRHFRNEEEYLNKRTLEMYNKVQSFHPDIIHIWGIEMIHSKIISYLSDIPFVVHIQGLASAYIFSYLAPGFSEKALKSSDNYLDRFFLKRGETFEYSVFKSRVERELSLIPKVKYWIGRTDWDRTFTRLLTPKSEYFHCDELMRSSFVGSMWGYHYDGKTINIQSSISCDWYKGIDVILNTASILRKIGTNISWNVFGWDNSNRKIKFFSKVLGIIPEEVGVHLMGCVDASEIKNGLLSCDCYVHPSYIENSSNAIAEAQLLGVPVIAQAVGGTPTMLRDDSGVLVAPNDPYTLAYKILEMTNRETAVYYSSRAFSLAKERHNPNKVCSDLLNIYNSVLNS